MRFATRITVFSLILVAAMVFTGFTWLRLTGSPQTWLPVAVGLLGLSYIPVAIFGFRLRHPLLRGVAIPAAAAFGFLSFALVAALGCWVIVTIHHLAPSHGGFSRVALAHIFFSMALLVFVGGLINAAVIRVTAYTVKLPNLPESWQGRRVVLVSDIHLGNIRAEAFAQRVVRRINQLEPKAVFIGGDLFDGARVDLVACAEPWGQLRAPSGTYFVTGNHDEFSDHTRILAALRAVGVHCVDDAKLLVEGLQIVGVHDGAAADPHSFGRLLAAAAIDPDAPSLLLNHQPHHLPIAEKAGISLQLSGHTHRGQFWPWTLLVARIYGPFAYGLNRLGGLQVITSSGVGTWGPPVRVGSRAEIVLIHLDRA